MISRILTGVHRDWWDDAQQVFVRTPLPVLGAGTTLAGLLMWAMSPTPAWPAPARRRRTHLL